MKTMSFQIGKNRPWVLNIALLVVLEAFFSLLGGSRTLLAQAGSNDAGQGPAPKAIAGSAPTSNPSCRWSHDFVGSDLDSLALQFTVFDDGTGPALYAAGTFFGAGSFLANGVAKWDGTRWAPLVGPRGAGVSNGDGDFWVEALVGFDDGSGPALYVGGAFSSAGGVPANNVAKWDGHSWSALADIGGNGVSGPVYSLAVFDDGTGRALYVGGSFDYASNVLANRVAKWDGHSWASLGGLETNGVSGNRVESMVVFDDGSGADLYVGGSFQVAGIATANNVARWDGHAWSPVIGPAGNGIIGWVSTLIVHDDGTGPALFAGGGFSNAGGVYAPNVARWRGGAWSAVMGATCHGPGVVFDLASIEHSSGPVLYAGGWFEELCSQTVNHIFRWDGHDWSPLAGPAGVGVDDMVYALRSFDDGTGPALYASGHFTSAGGLYASHVARWDGGSWSRLSEPTGSELDRPARALAFFDSGTGPVACISGDFIYAGGELANRVACWGSGGWSALGAAGGIGIPGIPMSRFVYTLAVWTGPLGPALYAAGDFDSAGGLPTDNVARWNGISWEPVLGITDYPPYVYNNVASLVVYDDGSGPALHAAGSFTRAQGFIVNNIARWDGSNWTPLVGPLAPGLSNSVYDLAVYDDGGGSRLCAAGMFTSAGGIVANRVACWDGQQWSALIGPSGNGLDGEASALAAHDDGSGPALFAGGYFFTAGGMSARCVAKWDGAAWSALGEAGDELNESVVSLVSFDDGTGPALYASGYFTMAGTTAMHSIGRWKNGRWSPVEDHWGEGFDREAFEMVAATDERGPALYAVGSFRSAGGFSSRYVAKWTCGAAIFSDGFESGDSSAWSVAVGAS